MGISSEKNDFEWGLKNRCLEKDVKQMTMKDFMLSDIFFMRANIKAKKGDYLGASEDFKNSILIKTEEKRDTNTADAYFNIGTCLLHLNDKENACKNLSKAGELGFEEAYDWIKKYCNN